MPQMIEEKNAQNSQPERIRKPSKPSLAASKKATKVGRAHESPMEAGATVAKTPKTFGRASLPATGDDDHGQREEAGEDRSRNREVPSAVSIVTLPNARRDR